MIKRKALVGICILITILFLPQLVIVLHYRNRIHQQVEQAQPAEIGVVFGAYVTEDGELTDVARERVEGAIMLYRAGRVAELFVSGDNRSNRQADAIAAYASLNGIPESAIIIDQYGIDTEDTCRHFRGGTAILLSQGYHLPRAMLMCEREGIDVQGLAVNHLGIVGQRGSGTVAIWATRAARFGRESALTWTYLLGAYGRMSDEAERLEAAENH